MLFKPQEIKDTEENATAGHSDAFVQEDGTVQIAVGKGTQGIADIIKLPLSKGITHFISDGCWSMHHLAEFFLHMAGPAHVHFTTWSISELSARKLCAWLKSGQILSLNAVLDFRSSNRHIEAYHLSKLNFTNLRLAYCHAKITVIHNEHWKIVINGSSNWTENPRIESGTITISDIIADKYINLINQIIEKSEYGIE